MAGQEFVLNQPHYTMEGVLAFLQGNRNQQEQERQDWEHERGELHARISLLESQCEAHEVLEVIETMNPSPESQNIHIVPRKTQDTKPPLVCEGPQSTQLSNDKQSRNRASPGAQRLSSRPSRRWT